MKYIAIMYSKEPGYQEDEWMALADSENVAKQSIFDGFNVHLMKQFEIKLNREHSSKIATIEFLEKELIDYYKEVLGGDLTLDTLESKFPIHILDVEKEECYRNGNKVPRKAHQY